MNKCQFCKQNEAAQVSQPFGPDEKTTFSAFGWHYRGFPVVPICESCYAWHKKALLICFKYREETYLLQYDGSIIISPF